AAGWRVVDVKYGRLLQHVFSRPGGAALRRRIDEMSNEEYQSLLPRRGADLRARLARPSGPDGPPDAEILTALAETPDDRLHTALSNLGGHDPSELLHGFSQADQDGNAPTVVFAYTIKGWGLPFAGDALNHSMLLSNDQMRALQTALGIADGAEWDAFPTNS